MASTVDDTIPVSGANIVALPIRTNFQRIKTEIEALQSAPGGGSGTVTSVATGAGLQGGPITASGTISMTNTGVTVGTYQGLTVDAQGRVTNATNQNYATTTAMTSALALLEARIAALEGGGGPVIAPVITSPLTASGSVGTAFSYTITASNNPTSFNATGLPGGLTFSGATISGTPAAAVTNHNITITATNAGGTDTKTLVLTVTAVAPTGWEVTYNFPSPPTVFNMTTGKIALNAMTGWQPAHAADMTDALYDATSQATLPVQLYAKYSSDADFRQVDFDNWGGTPASNKVTEWGFSSGDMSIYIIGSNSTSNPIQLRLVKV